MNKPCASLHSLDHDTQHSSVWTVYVDGASRNNPGLAGAGIYILKNGETFEQQGYFLGIKTNNQAEYLALLLGLFLVQQYISPHDRVTVISDSQLLVHQINGLYRVKHPDIKPLHALAYGMLNQVQGTIHHVLRGHNLQADVMANRGIDTKNPLSSEFRKFLSEHNITF